MPATAIELRSPGIDYAREYRALLSFLYQAPFGLMQIAPDGAIEMITPAAARLLLALAARPELDNLYTALADVAPQLPRLVREYRGPSGALCEALRFALPAGSLGPEASVLTLTLTKVGPQMLMAVLNDVTNEVRREQRDLDQRLTDLSRTDALTGLPNRAVAIERLQRLIDARREDESTPPFALILVNIDRFHQVNDSLGHAAGDEILRLLAARLNTQLRRHVRDDGASAPAVVATRVGNDEFAIVVDDLRRSDDIHGIAMRLLDVVAQPFGVGEQQLHVRVSAGIVLAAQAARTGVEMLNDANIAVNESRRAGRGRYAVFEPSMRERAASRGLIEEGLRGALERHELYVVYQPVVELGEEGDALRCTGVEALVRWLHPQRGIVPPIEFIGIAEDSGLIGDLGRHVLAIACEQFMRWRARLGDRAPGTLAVNVSRAQLFLPDLVDMVRDTMCSTEMPPGCLQLEITESMAAEDDEVRVALAELKALGVSLALDDFGTGYSSLSSLHRLPVDLVKIDRSFVSQVDSSNYHRVLVEATVQVARSLDLGTVAEGIETESQARLVRQLGCEKGQGYLYSTPLTAPALEAWLATGACAALP
ncbi:MAG: EAL domain-containing protein [Burkholderiales bacterium]|nr:EAL domain-containing protein [Burkholderiales bacterium]